MLLKHISKATPKFNWLEPMVSPFASGLLVFGDVCDDGNQAALSVSWSTFFCSGTAPICWFFCPLPRRFLFFFPPFWGFMEKPEFSSPSVSSSVREPETGTVWVDTVVPAGVRIGQGDLSCSGPFCDFECDASGGALEFDRIHDPRLNGPAALIIFDVARERTEGWGGSGSAGISPGFDTSTGREVKPPRNFVSACGPDSRRDLEWFP